MSLKSVKNKIKSIDKTRQVTKAMEAVSAVKMRKSQAAAIGTRPYAISALKILRGIAGAIEATKHPLMTKRDGGKTCVIIVTADKGLAGNYGAAILKFVYRYFAKEELTKENTTLITIGKKALEHFSKRGWTIEASFEKWSDQFSFPSIDPLAERVRSLFEAGEVTRVVIVYTNLISTLKQEVYARQLLPVVPENVEEAIRGITPERGRFSELRSEAAAARTTPETVFEPSPEEVLTELIPMLFKIEMYHAILEANASEHSSRMIAMKNASDNAKEISRALKLRFNKVRQAAITKEVSEIVGGMESMKVPA